MIEQGVYNLLRTTAAVTEIVTATAGKVQIYPVRIPEDGGRPCVVYSRTGTDYTDGLDDTGDTAEQTGPDTARFRLECWGDGPDGYKVACTLADAVVSLWRTQKGALGVNTTLKSKHSTVEDCRDEDFEQQDGSDKKRFLRVVDITIEYDPGQV